MKKLMHLSNARVPAQKKQMEEIAQRGICPFCREHFEANHKAPILKETKHWLATRNDYPYEGSKNHFLLVHKSHIECMRDLKSPAAKELGSMLAWIESEFSLPGGTFLMRFGDMRYNGATIAHLHAHVITGIKEGNNSEPIRKKIGFKKK
jgi:diadenosine tetraphosphate (Ap4A) HIT family hydrolase